MKKITIYSGFIFLVSAIFFAPLEAQNLADAFQAYIPQALSASDTNKHQLSARLAQLGEIHPDLIYHYLEFLNAQFAQPRSSQALRLYQRFNAMEKHYKQRRHEWATRQLSNLIKRDDHSEICQLAQRYFEVLLVDPTIQKPDEEHNIAIDADKLNCLTVQFYQRNKKINCSTTSDYLGLRRLLEEKLRDEFARKKSALSAIPRLSHGKLIKNFLSYWHLYDGQRDSTFASDFILTIQQHHYSLHDVPNDLIKPPRLAIASGLYHNKTYRFINGIPIAETNRELPLGKSTAFSQNLFSIQLRQPLRKHLSMFSYLNIQMTYAGNAERERFAFNNSLAFNWVVEDTMAKITTFYNETVNFTKGKININLQKSYLGKLSVPIIVFTKNITVEAGALFGRNRIVYQVEYSYRYRLIETKFIPNQGGRTTILKDVASGNRAYAKTLTHWFVWPSLACVVQLPYRLIFEVGVFKKYETISIGFALI